MREHQKPSKPSAHSQWHHDQRTRVLKAHPELRRLYGSEPLQLIPIVGLLLTRWGVAYCVGVYEAPLWLIGVLACTFGCWTVHAAGTYIHEQGHRLVVAAEPAATAVDVLLEACATTFGYSVSYQHKHVNFHHVYLGDYEWDSEMRDLCAHVSVVSAEQRAYLATRGLVLLEGCLALLLPAAGLVAQDVAEAVRAALLLPADVRPSDGVRRARFALPPRLAIKQRAFVGVSIAMYALCWRLCGLRACVFGLWSLAVKSSRFDVIGWGQDMAEHNAHDDARPKRRPTNTTHTAWNWLFCNTGYHTEHHTFPAVPGCYLPRLSRAAPEEFAPCVASVPWAALWLQWARSSFKSFRVTPQQLDLAHGGRCGAGGALRGGGGALRPKAE